jgi:DNA polymerase-3 subunit epsilon
LIGRERLIDTLLLARRKYPGGSNRLDDLCVRYRIDNSHRTKHGALLDAELLADVYVELIDARQASLVLVEAGDGGELRHGATTVRARPMPLPSRLTESERVAHRSFVKSLGGDAIWNSYLALPAELAAAAQTA